MTPPLERFWSRVDIWDPLACWQWRGLRDPKGYGSLYAHGRSIKAHRFSYEELVGPIPGGLVLDHLCRVPSCVNPYHLEPVTSRENTLRGVSIVAQCAAKTHCKRGHLFNATNISRNSRGYRICKTCRIEQERLRLIGKPRKQNRKALNTLLWVFWTRVAPAPDDVCWPWLGGLDKFGYGRYSFGRLAHRIAYEDRFGPAPNGASIGHTCGMRHCVNPAHLFLKSSALADTDNEVGEGTP